MKAWGSNLDPIGETGVNTFYPTPMLSVSLNLPQIRFLGDPSAAFTSALDLSFDSAAIFGNNRSKRYALVTQDGQITKIAVEPDNTGVDGMSFYA